MLFFPIFFFFKQKTAYEMRISDWSSDVCSSDLHQPGLRTAQELVAGGGDQGGTFAQRGGGVGLVRQARVRSQQAGADVDHQRNGQSGQVRSEQRRVGTESVSTCRSLRSR